LIEEEEVCVSATNLFKRSEVIYQNSERISLSQIVALNHVVALAVVFLMILAATVVVVDGDVEDELLDLDFPHGVG